MHTIFCNESLTLKVGTIQIRQLLRLYPDSWLEAGSISIPELRINAKLECHPPTPSNVNEQLEFLRRHDQHSQRLHFLYNIKSQQTSTGSSSLSTTTVATNLKRPSTIGLVTNLNVLSCACLGGSSNYYTLVPGEQFFKSSYHLSEQASFGCSLFRPDLHVIHSHPIFQHKYNWHNYEHLIISNNELDDEEIFYPFDFCAQPTQSNERYGPLNDHELRHSMSIDLYSLSRTNSSRNVKRKSVVEQEKHKRSSSSIPLSHMINSPTSSSTATTKTTMSDVYLTPNEQLSLINSSQSSLNSIVNIIESSSMSSVTMIQHQSSTRPSANLNSLSKSTEMKTFSDHSSRTSSSSSSSSDSLISLEEILQKQQTRYSSAFLPEKVNNKN